MSDELPRPNVELLDLTLATVRKLAADQEKRDYSGDRWKQVIWRVAASRYGDDDRCGTAMCFAGWTCQIEAQQRGDQHPWLTGPDEDLSEYLRATPEEIEAEVVKLYDDNIVVSAAHRAIRVLGLTEEEADDLFEGNNSLQDIEAAVNRIKARA